MKAKKFFASVSIAILVIIAGIIVFVMYENPTVDSVSKIEMSNATSNSVSIKWKSASANGYLVYQLGEDGFSPVANITDSKTTEYTAESLDEASEYCFYVTAYKTRGDRRIESKDHTEIKAHTIPSAQKFVSVSSDTPRTMDLEWELNNKVSGYQLQYVKGKGDDFSSATTIDVDDFTKVSYSAKELAEKKVYTARVRSYVFLDKKRVYGPWSDIASVKIAEEIKLPNGLDPNKPMVALTFDDGPGYNSASDDILDVLEKYNARATFFMVGENAASHPKNLQRKVALGMQIGNHTYDHSHFGKNVTANDIKKASDAIYKACGVYPTAFRSPGGNTTDAIRTECTKEKMPLYYWSLDTNDWKYRDANHVYNAVMKHVEDGDIILMHEIYPSTADAVKKMVPALIKQGYQLVTCDELVQAKTGKYPKYGTQYVDGDSIRNETR